MTSFSRRAIVSVLAIAVVGLLLGLATDAHATVPVPPRTPDDALIPPDIAGPQGMRTLPAPLGPFNYLREFAQIAAFLAQWQYPDAHSLNYGGEIEAESGELGGVIQTDNTLEAIWVWSRFRELTGRTDYDAYVANAWQYCLQFPAWNEEGSVGDDYYRVHNCAWGLTAVLQYQAATGDMNYESYAVTCAAYIRTHSLNLNVTDTWSQRLRAFVKGWAAGSLYLYAEAIGDPALMSTAVNQGQDVLAWLDAAPSARLGWEYWAMSAGTCVWGVCNSVFRDDPAAGSAWIDLDGGYVDVWQDWYNTVGYDWNSAWNVAYANGHFAMYDITGNTTYRDNGVLVTDALLSLDTDDDGGITAETVDQPTEDMTWVTTYLTKFCLNRLIGTPADDDVGILRFVGVNDGDVFGVGEPIPIAILATNYGLADQTGVSVTLSGDWGDASFTRDLAFAAMDTVAVDADWTPPSGTYTLTATTSLPGDADPANDTVSVTVQVGTPSATPDGALAFGARPTVNPFGEATALRLALAHPAQVLVDIYDLRGRRVARLQNGPLDGGSQLVAWDGRDTSGRAAPSGVYLYRVQVGAASRVGKLVKVQ